MMALSSFFAADVRTGELMLKLMFLIVTGSFIEYSADLTAAVAEMGVNTGIVLALVFALFLARAANRKKSDA